MPAPDRTTPHRTPRLVATAAAGQQGSGGAQPDSGGPAQLRSTWTKDGQTLLVAAAELDERDSQLSLSLSGV